MSHRAPEKSFWNLKSLALSGLILAAVFSASFADAASVFPAFSSRGLEGEAVTDAVFTGAKLTMINIWATWCPPCIAEMPDLGRLARSMPEGSQLVGVILDAGDSGALDKAKGILAKANADFLQILPADAMWPVIGEVDAIPTTIFVDSRGNVVGEPLVGSRPEEAYRSEIEKILKSIK
jgi:thiol-disulfide isomerase/thioredoxin